MSEATIGRAMAGGEVLGAVDALGGGVGVGASTGPGAGAGAGVEGVASVMVGDGVALPDVLPRDAAWPGVATPARPEHRRHVDRETATRQLPRGELSAFQRWFRHWFSRTVSGLLMKTWFKVTVVGRERFQDRPCLYAFNHLSWMDPMLLLATFPSQPRLYFYGPKELDLRTGKRNRFMWWTGVPIPFSPNKDDLLTSVKRAQAVFDSGGALAIAPEGSIHVHEGDLLTFQEGAAYLALRAGVPIVPVAITGISWARFRGRVVIRIGEPIETAGVRPTRQSVARYSAISWHALKAMVRDDRDGEPPGRFEQRLTDLFNDWGEGGREAATDRRGPDPADVPIEASAAE